MERLRNKKITQKIVIALVVVILFNFAVPLRSHAIPFVSDLLEELVHLIAALGDVVMGAFNYTMLGAGFDSATLDNDNVNLDDSSSTLYAGNEEADFTVEEEDLDGLGWGDYIIPNFLYTPEKIFSNQIAALDINFLDTSRTYTPVDDSDDADDKSKTIASVLAPTIAAWYNSFRNIAIVGLLSVLVYLGIRILLGATAQDKAKYKERIKDWVFALCLVFIMHFIMAGIVNITEKITDLFSNSISSGIIVEVKDGSDTKVKFKTDLMGYLRFIAQADDFMQATAMTMMYIALIVLTLKFTFTYLKRVLYMAFFTMIAPLVALTYPIDKVRDGKAQAFDMWFKEYTMNAIIQPVHLILYATLIGSAASLAANNPLYAIVAIGFLVPAEKFIKKMFGLDRAESPSGFGSVAAGSFIGNQLANATKRALPTGKGGSNGSGTSNDDSSGGGRIRTVDRNDLDPQNNLSVGADETPRLGGAQQEDESGVGSADGPVDMSRYLTEEQRDELHAESLQPGDQEYTQYLRQHGITAEDEVREQARLTQEQQQQLEEQQATQRIRDAESRASLNDSAVDPSAIGTGGNVVDVASQTPERRTVGDRIRDVGATQIGNMQNKLDYLNNNKGDIAKRAGRSVLKTGAKVGGAAAGAVVAGTVTAVAAGGAMLADGDPTKVAQVIAGGVGAGALAGAGKGGTTADKAMDSIESATKNSGWYTQEELEQKDAKKFDNEWKHNDENRKFLQSKGLKPAEVKEFLNRPNTQEYLDQGITDINAIYNAQKMVEKGDLTHKEALSRAKAAKSYKNGMSKNDKTEFIKDLVRKNVSEAQATAYVNDMEKITKKG